MIHKRGPLGCVLGVWLAEPIGELDTAEAPSGLECFFDVELWPPEAAPPWCREEFAAKVVYIERSLN